MNSPGNWDATVQWCQRLGPKLQDESISLDGLFRSFVRPRPLEERPPLAPLAIDWPWIAYAEVSDSVKVEIEGTEGLLIDSELVVTDHTEEGATPFEVRVGDLALAYEATVNDRRWSTAPSTVRRTSSVSALSRGRSVSS